MLSKVLYANLIYYIETKIRLNIAFSYGLRIINGISRILLP